MALRFDRRAVSEGAGVAVLVGITVLVVAFVGASVIFSSSMDDDEHLEFAFIYSPELNQLTIQYEDDDNLTAGEVYVDGPANNLSWAELAETPDNTSLMDMHTVFIQDRGPYGTVVNDDDHFQIVHVPAAGEATVIAEWNAPEEAEDAPDIDIDDPFEETSSGAR